MTKNKDVFIHFQLLVPCCSVSSFPLILSLVRCDSQSLLSSCGTLTFAIGPSRTYASSICVLLIWFRTFYALYERRCTLLESPLPSIAQWTILNATR